MMACKTDIGDRSWTLQEIGRDRLADFLRAAAEQHPGDDWAGKYAERAVERLNIDDRGAFEKRLVAAKAAHVRYEKEMGVPDPDWPAWYANHMLQG